MYNWNISNADKKDFKLLRERFKTYLAYDNPLSLDVDSQCVEMEFDIGHIEISVSGRLGTRVETRYGYVKDFPREYLRMVISDNDLNFTFNRYMNIKELNEIHDKVVELLDMSVGNKN